MSGGSSLSRLCRSSCSFEVAAAAAAAAASSSLSSPLPISLPTTSSVHEQRSLTMSGRPSLYQLYRSACSAAAAVASSSSSSPSPTSTFSSSWLTELPEDVLREILARIYSNDHVRLNGFWDFDGMLMSPELMQRVAYRGGQGNSLVLLNRMPSGSVHVLRRKLFSNNGTNPEEDFQAVTIPYLPDEIRRSVPRWPVQIRRCFLAGAARGCVALFIDLVSGRRMNNPPFITLFNTIESETGLTMFLSLGKRFHRCAVLLAFLERGDRNPFLMIANETTHKDRSKVLVYNWAQRKFEKVGMGASLHEISPMRGLTARAVNLGKNLYWLTVGGRKITRYSDGKGFGQHPLPPGREIVDDIFVIDGGLMTLTSTEALEIWRWNGSWELHRLLSPNPSRAVRFVGSFSKWLIAVKRRGLFNCTHSLSEATTLRFAFSEDALQVDETQENLLLLPDDLFKECTPPSPSPSPSPSW